MASRSPTENDIAVLRGLQALATKHTNLFQFRSLVGARQYVPLYDLVRKYIRPGATVLDWGAGNGHFSYFLIRSGYQAVGYSLYEEQFPEWLGDRDYRLVIGDTSDPVNLPFADDSFDAAASVGVLEHVRETGGEETASLREIRRILRPNGTVICYHFPNRYSWVDAVARVVPGAEHHTYRFTPRDISHLVESAGLRLVEAGGYAFLPRNPLHRLPDWIVQSDRFARAYDGTDLALGSLIQALCTNHYFVARKPDRVVPQVA